MTEDEREALARLAYAAHLARFGGAAGPRWEERDREQRDFYRVVAEAVAAEVRRQERATLSVLLESAEHEAADYWDGVGCLDDGEARRYGELNGAVNGLRTALAALEEDR